MIMEIEICDNGHTGDNQLSYCAYCNIKRLEAEIANLKAENATLKAENKSLQKARDQYHANASRMMTAISEYIHSDKSDFEEECLANIIERSDASLAIVKNSVEQDRIIAIYRTALEVLAKDDNFACTQSIARRALGLEE